MDVEFDGKQVLVVGMARSGLAAADLLSKNRAKVRVSDTRSRDQLAHEIQKLEEAGLPYEVGGHRLESFLEADVIVVSPGVPLDITELKVARELGKLILSELELACRFLRGKIIGITGTNGKTTTTSLVGEILKTAGFRVQVGGNIGTALSTLVEPSTPETLNVVEISSFQLEAIHSFRPDIAVILNITPDHLDRHKNFADYIRVKLNIFRNQKPSDFAVLNREDINLSGISGTIRADTWWFSNRQNVESGTGVDGSQLVFRRENKVEVQVPLVKIQLRGSHNLENIAAAITVARLVGAAPATVVDAVSRFKGVEHRLELVDEIHGVKFYNDSKATNVDATIKALEAFESGLILILGGKDKGSDYTVLRCLISARVKTIILLGEASAKIRGQLEGTVPIEQANSMREAVDIGFQFARQGDTVLLAPACASFDMFQNFEHRGHVFKEAVQQLKETVSSRSV
jgi:UDP-N-acetylmuramoylalanine--D-glutamate ligase